VQTLPQLLPPVEMGTTQQENPVTNTTASFTEKEFKLLELAVYTAIRQGYHEGVSQEHINELSELRYKLLSCVSEANYYAVS
jgi:hypothetical protein